MSFAKFASVLLSPNNITPVRPIIALSPYTTYKPKTDCWLVACDAVVSYNKWEFSVCSLNSRQNACRLYGRLSLDHHTLKKIQLVHAHFNKHALWQWNCTMFTARRYAGVVLAVVICPSVRLSVRPSICLSVSHRYCIKTAKRRITQTTLRRLTM